MRSKRVALVALGALTVGLLPTASPARVPDNVRITKVAFAGWSSRVDAQGRFTQRIAVAFATRYQDSSADEVVGGFFKSSCDEMRTRRFVRIDCEGGAGVGGKLDQDAFELDPALQSARLSIEERGQRHHATWTGRDVPDPYQSFEACWSVGEGGEEESGEGQGGGVFRSATAEGHALGKKLEGRRRIALLMTEFAVTECRFMSQRSLDALAAGDFDRVRYSYRIAR